jgi:SAM-dependent methyltransferase
MFGPVRDNAAMKATSRPGKNIAIVCLTLLVPATSILAQTQANELPVKPAPDMEVPFVVSSPIVTRTMLEMAKVTRNDFVLDLGSGDGRIIFAAARQYGARGLGVEIDPALVETAEEDARKLRLTNLVSFRAQDLFATDLSVASVITMYLLPDVNLALRDRLLALQPGTRVVSHDWDMGDWEPDERRVIDNPEKSLGVEKTSAVMLWVIPAKMAGKWCASQPKQINAEAMQIVLNLEQRYQRISGDLTATSTEAVKPLKVRFRATVSGTRFAIPHPTTDAAAEFANNAIALNGEPYGLARMLRFTRESCAPTTPLRAAAHQRGSPPTAAHPSTN